MTVPLSEADELRQGVARASWTLVIDRAEPLTHSFVPWQNNRHYVVEVSELALAIHEFVLHFKGKDFDLDGLTGRLVNELYDDTGPIYTNLESLQWGYDASLLEETERKRLHLMDSMRNVTSRLGL